MSTILIIDDDKDFCETMASLVERMEHDCLAAHNLSDGIQVLQKQHVDLLLLDVRLPDGNGIDYLPTIKESSISSPEIFIVTGIGDPDGAEIAIREGVWDYIIKPTKIKEIRLSLNRALKYREEKRRKHQAVNLDLNKIVGNSPQIKGCFETLAQAATSNAPVLINGETGTGKELFAKTIHQNSSRQENGFIVVDCASLTETLLESTLFGHKKGSFTGAETQKTGLITLANSGTLFLDEVGEMPLSTQKTFLRVLQEKQYRPVGETKELTSNFRLIAATNKDLHDLVEIGGFRKDLLFRLCAIQIKIPPLKFRQGDIKLLSLFHVNRLCEEYEVSNKGFEQGFFEILEAYDWPGNVRELFHVLEMAFIASGNENTLYPMHLPKEIRINVAKRQIGDTFYQQPTEDDPAKMVSQIGLDFIDPKADSFPTFKEFKHSMEIKYLHRVISGCNGEPAEILKRSGLSKSHYYSLLKKYDIKTHN
ncbi:MAG: sigma-54 dependent transcriptional regulator [Proteobacteria bacterium]|nr:sigma-54 dependent transcriptional regulator [Pseudomonadota bacterium]